VLRLPTGTAEEPLLLSVGDPDALPVDVPLEDEVANLFWEIVRGVSEGVRPAWVSPPVARSALAFRDALADAASQVEVRRGDGVRVEFVPGEARRDIWVIPDRKVTAELSEATGRLEAVDLRTNKFRIRDDVGNGIDLEDVVDADAVAPLVGQRTKGVGRAVFDSRGQLKSLREATVDVAHRPEAWVPGGTADWEAILRQALGPDPRGVEGFTDDDVQEFLSLLRG